MKKTDKKAYITQHIDNRHDKACRRVWEDDQHIQYVKISGMWIPVRHFKVNPHFTIKLEWSPCGI